MKTIWQMTLEDIYLDWVNNFLSPEGFAAYYGISEQHALELITLLRELNISDAHN